MDEKEVEPSIADQLCHSGALAHLRLVEIYERQGERQKARDHYARFAELSKDTPTLSSGLWSKRPGAVWPTEAGSVRAVGERRLQVVG